MSDNALSPCSNPSDNLKERINNALAPVAKSASAAFKQAKANNRAYALLGTGINVFTVPSNLVTESMPPRNFLGRVPLDPLLYLDVAPQNIRYGEDVLESGMFGESRNGELVNPAFSLQDGTDKIDLCNIFLCCSYGLSELQDLPALRPLARSLDRQNLKVFVALAGHVPQTPSVRPYAAEIALVVCRDNEAEKPLFNLGDHVLRPSGYKGRGSSPYAPPMAEKVQYTRPRA